MIALHTLYLKDETLLAYKAFETFGKIMRLHDMLITDYIIKFERLYNKAKNYKMEIHDGVLAYRLLDSANLSENNKQLVTATLSETKYSVIKKKLNKVFTSDNTSVSYGIKLEEVKNESAFYNTEKLIVHSRRSYDLPRGGRRGSRYPRDGNGFTGTRRETNPLDEGYRFFIGRIDVLIHMRKFDQMTYIQIPNMFQIYD